ncbi:MAG: sulfotransferase [Candidatus Pacebacteria bacterium]|nr:sulfotransferase [Candidatus Paceibacterota bacterium]
MGDKEYYFISGFPRSGSTLLANILAQNPRFHATATSGIMDIMFGVRNQWDKLIEFQASPNDSAKLRVLRGILDNYYADIDKPVVFDKSRGWLSLLEMAEHVLGHKAKVLVPVRDLRDVLASFEKLWRKNSVDTQISQESDFYFQFQTVQGRSDVWMKQDQPVGLAYRRVTDAIQRGFRDRMFLVDFDDMTRDPEGTFKQIYQFLGEEPFEHDFNNVEQVTWENDALHGFKDLHKIKSKVEPMEPQWPKVLGGFADKYKELNFWKK